MQNSSKLLLLDNFNWRKYLLTVVSVWMIVSLLICLRWGAFRLSQGYDAQWLHITIYTYSAAFLWILLAPLFPLIIQKISNAFSDRAIIILLHITLALLITAFHSCIFLIIDYNARHWLGLETAQETVFIYISTYFSGIFLDGLVSYGVFIGLLIGYLLYLRNQSMANKQTQLEKHLMQSRIKNLHYQLQPHFLFNSMQTISNLMHKDVTISRTRPSLI